MLLDGDPAAVTGSPPDSSFDVAVRVAGSILLAQVRRGRRCVLLLNTAGAGDAGRLVGRAGVAACAGASRGRGARRARAGGGAASARLTRRQPARSSSWSSPLGSSGHLSTVCSSAPLTRRPVALVHVEPESFAGRPRRADPELLRLQAAGVPIAVVRQGEDLAAALRWGECGRGGACVGRGGPPRSALRRSSSWRSAWLRLEQPVWSLWRRARPPRPRSRSRPASPALGSPRRRRGRDHGRGADRRGSRLRPVAARPPRLGVRPLGLLATFGTRFGNGFGDFYGTHLPFDPRVHVAMNELVLFGVFLFCARRRTARGGAEARGEAGLVLLVGAGWPATLLGPSHGVAMGVGILGALLVLLAGSALAACRLSRCRRPRSWRRGCRGRLGDGCAPWARAVADVESGARCKRADGRGLRLERAVRRTEVVGPSHDRAPGAICSAADLPARGGARRFQRRRVEDRSSSPGRLTRACGRSPGGRTRRRRS